MGNSGARVRLEHRLDDLSLPTSAEFAQETPAPNLAQPRGKPPGFIFASGSGGSTALHGALRAVWNGS